MTFIVRQWPGSVQKEIEALPDNAAEAVLVMLREMRKRGPRPEEYKIKPLPRHLHGLNQVSMKINKEQIRVLFSVYGQCIVLFHAFKKTSPQVEQRGYELALTRKKTAEQMLSGGANELPTFH